MILISHFLNIVDQLNEPEEYSDNSSDIYLSNDSHSISPRTEHINTLVFPISESFQVQLNNTISIDGSENYSTYSSESVDISEDLEEQEDTDYEEEVVEMEQDPKEGIFQNKLDYFVNSAGEEDFGYYEGIEDGYGHLRTNMETSLSDCDNEDINDTEKVEELVTISKTEYLKLLKIQQAASSFFQTAEADTNLKIDALPTDIYNIDHNNQDTEDAWAAFNTEVDTLEIPDPQDCRLVTIDETKLQGSSILSHFREMKLNNQIWVGSLHPEQQHAIIRKLIQIVSDLAFTDLKAFDDTLDNLQSK